MSNGRRTARSEQVRPLAKDYIPIQVTKPSAGYLADGTPFTGEYIASDGAAADLDGDGKYEIVFFWVPDNQKDNSQSGITANVYIDAYTLDGTKVWPGYIDLGPNIRAGAHYQTYVIADFDGDGKAEIAVKTAPGTKDTAGTVIGAGKYIAPIITVDPNDPDTSCLYVYDPAQGDPDHSVPAGTAFGSLPEDWVCPVCGAPKANFTELSGARYVQESGYVLGGPEYLSVFNGATGTLMDTADYIPNRGGHLISSLWGDNNGHTYGNRVDRYVSCAAYLDGIHPSIVMQRGYYTRTCLTAYDWDGSALTVRWTFDTRADTAGIDSTNWDRIYESNGNHNLTAADVDGDGADEILLGGLTIDNDGSPLYVTRRGHGDAMHIGDLDPERPGLEAVVCHEESPYGITMYDARTGTTIWHFDGSADTGRVITADIDPDSPGEETWSTLNSVNFGVIAASGEPLSASPPSFPAGFSMANMTSVCNYAIYWDGDTARELFDGGYEESAVIVKGVKQSQGVYQLEMLKEFTGMKTQAGTKRNPLFQGDILGDWREELILRSEDSAEIRIYMTVHPSVHEGPGAVPETGIPALTDNRQYRMSLIWQHSGYNQPPHTSWFIGYNMAGIRD